MNKESKTKASALIALSLLGISFSSFAAFDDDVACPKVGDLNPFINDPFPQFPGEDLGPVRVQKGSGEGIILFGWKETSIISGALSCAYDSNMGIVRLTTISRTWRPALIYIWMSNSCSLRTGGTQELCRAIDPTKALLAKN